MPIYVEVPVTINARVLLSNTDEANAKGSSKPRLLPAGAAWNEWDVEFCIHGEKLRWSCDECDEYFAVAEDDD